MTSRCVLLGPAFVDPTRQLRHRKCQKGPDLTSFFKIVHKNRWNIFHELSGHSMNETVNKTVLRAETRQRPVYTPVLCLSYTGIYNNTIQAACIDFDFMAVVEQSKNV